MIVQAQPQTPHFFLIGTRAPAGGAGPAGSGERVAVLVATQRVHFDGSVGAGDEVRAKDTGIDEAWLNGPLRYEAEIAPAKPVPDAVVVDALAGMLPGGPFAPPAAVEAALAATVFGSVEVRRTTPAHVHGARRFGWRPRGTAPRLGLSGNAGNFDPGVQALPANFSNAFFNGQPLDGEALFNPGDTLAFIDAAAHSRVLRIPQPPVTLAITRDGAPLQPPAAMQLQVDTVVMDLAISAFNLVWRAVLPWEARFAGATLQVKKQPS